MTTIEFIREQLGQAREFIAGTLADVPAEQAHETPPGALNSIAATYAHLVTGEDGFVNALIRGGVPMFATEWAGRTGLSEPPPVGPGWLEWGQRLRVDLDALGAYASAVHAGTDAYLATLTDRNLERSIDLSAIGFGERTLGWVLGAGVLGHRLSHWGEICALKGLQGGRGFPYDGAAMSYDERLAERVRAALAGTKGVSERKMFGGIAFLVDGKMAVGVVGDELMARVGRDGHAAALAKKHTRVMDFTGRPMTGMVYVSGAGTRGAALANWVDECVAFARAATPSRPRAKKLPPRKTPAAKRR